MNYQKLDWQKIKGLKALRDLATPPRNLYRQGSASFKIFEACVAVVGSRKMTDYGQRAVEKIVPQIVQSRKTVVSGFMYGVDQYAHQVCVGSGGKTIAVLGWGIAEKLSEPDSKLANKIIESGGIMLSEWEFQPPSHWTFPTRNRIIAALCEEVIIIEAAEKSGSLITAKIANSLKRTVRAVPGPITSRTSQGTNNLIATGKAKMWLGTITQTATAQNDDPILQTLKAETLSADELARKLNAPISEIGAKLSMLLLSGQVLQKSGKYYLADAS